MKLKVIQQRDYREYGDQIELELDKPLPIGWFRNKMLLDGKEICVTPGMPAQYIEVSEPGDYVGKIFEIPDEQIKRGYREQ